MQEAEDHPLTLRWNALFRGRQVSEAADIGIDLIRRWQEPQRTYHTIEHLDMCLQLLEVHLESAKDPRFVEMALWYHDAVYDPKRTDNETKSAELALNDLEWIGEDSRWSKRVAAAILATATHQTGGDPDIGLILDIDLAILASDSAAYRQFELNIRHEYRHAHWVAFCNGRIRILNDFLARDRIYQSGLFDETRARHNLTRAVQVLTTCPDEANYSAQLSG
jgi:predicted metal-dependent HD superfamily phosphohydrolase